MSALTFYAGLPAAPTEDLAQRVGAFSDWRRELARALHEYAHWSDDSGLGQPEQRERIERMVERLSQDRLSIAFVAEFSRGKSELINALFFASYGRRVLPSSSGRTTMCPTELMYDPGRSPSLRLLPIETRRASLSLSQWRDDAPAWHEIRIDPEDAESMARAFESVRDTLRVPLATAVELGMAPEVLPGAAPDAPLPDEVEIPRWRHAIANIPDPLLKQGLVIIDTPGLNAIGAEPELTLKLIPSADAVLFVLAADAGVSRSDIQVWRDSIAPAHQSGRFVVLNKIDSLWDSLRGDAQVELELASQVASVSTTLDVPPERIFPVSAQKALVGKVQGDRQLLRRSRLPVLEHALAHDLIPQQQALVCERIGREFDEIASSILSLANARHRSAVEQLFELNGLRGKNRVVIDHIATRIKSERADFDASLRHLQALRAVLARHSQSIFGTIGRRRLRSNMRQARELMAASNFSIGLRDGMGGLLDAARRDFDAVASHIGDVATLMTAMYRTFNAEHGLSLGMPGLLSIQSYQDEFAQVEELHRRQFGALSLVTTEKRVLVRRFFDSVAARLAEIYEQAGRDIEVWLRSLMSPIETQVREHQAQLRLRLDSVNRVLEASGSLDARIAEIETSRDQALANQQAAEERMRRLRLLLARRVEAGRPQAAR